MKEEGWYHITENGFTVDGSNKVCVPEARIKATDFIEAAAIMSKFLETRVKPDCMELITPMERIKFDD